MNAAHIAKLLYWGMLYSEIEYYFYTTDVTFSTEILYVSGNLQQWVLVLENGFFKLIGTPNFEFKIEQNLIIIALNLVCYGDI